MKNLLQRMSKRKLAIFIGLMLALLPLTAFSLESESIQLRNRMLSASPIVGQESEGFYMVEVDIPVSKETYDLLSSQLVLETFIQPSVYVVKSTPQELRSMQKVGLVHRMWKYTDEKNADVGLSGKEEVVVSMALFSSANHADILSKAVGKGIVMHAYPHSIIMKTQGREVSSLANTEGVEWVSEAATPEVVNDVAAIITGAAAERARFSMYGQGEIIAIADTGLDSGNPGSNMHDDLQGRILSLLDVAVCGGCSTNPNDNNGHGTHVAGTALGDGRLSGSSPGANNYANSYAGVAPKAQLVFQAMGNDLGTNNVHPPDLIAGLFQPAYNQGARVHSNSWGINSPSNFGVYQIPARDIDKFIWNNKNMSIVFAVGNWAWQGGAYRNDTIAPHAVAKNAVSVGASENYKPSIAEPSTLADNPNQVWLSGGRGPTDDGRVKPDIVVPGTEVFSARSRAAPAWPSGGCTKNQSVAQGMYTLGPDYSTCTGTSMAAPHVAGMVALIREYYRAEHQITPSSALIKATLINSATDIGYGIPSTIAGWGRVNLSAVLPSSERTLFFIDKAPGLATSQKTVCALTNVNAGSPFKATLVWSDKEGAILSQKNLINNLDLVIIDPRGKKHNGNDLAAPFDDQLDNTNNVEQVIIPRPWAGEYTFAINATNVPFPNQPFALVISYSPAPQSGNEDLAPVICLLP